MSRTLSLAVLLALASLFCLADGSASAAVRQRARVAAHRAKPSARKQPGSTPAASRLRDRKARRQPPAHAIKGPAVSRVAGRRTADLHTGRTGRLERHSAGHHRRATVSDARLSNNGNPGPRQATPEDFLEAAGAARARREPATRATSHPERPVPSDAAARPTPVVNVIRPISQRPQLPSITQAVEEPIVLPRLTDERGRLVVPAPLRGSHEILMHQNQMADDDGLGRVQDDADLEAMRRKGMLVLVPESMALHVDDRLPANRRVCRPWTAQFLASLSRAHYARFGTPLQLNSAVRTVAFQQHLLRVNGNAAPALGDTASPHLTGQAIDLAKHGLSLTEIAWLRGYLLPLIEAGKIDVEEEFQQSCFHISVYRRYLPPAIGAERYTVASRGLGPALAPAMP